MHNKHLISAGFYLMLIFSLAAAIFPLLAYLAASLLFMLWLLDLLIYREPEFIRMPLFYPILGFMAILMISGLISVIYGIENNYVYLALLSLFYFVVPGFVITNEQRRKILWTFAAGVLIYSGIRLIDWWVGMTQPVNEVFQLAQPQLSLIAMAVCVMAAFIIEAEGWMEKLFFVLVCLPPIAISVLAADKVLILALIAIVLALAIIRDRRLLIPIGILALISILGLGGIHYYLERNFDIVGYGELLLAPFESALYNPNIVSGASFFGGGIFAQGHVSDPNAGNSFFLSLIEISGPPAFLLSIYMFIERARESYFKRRKVTLAEEKSYHLAVLLLIVALFVLNLYDAAFIYPNVVLATLMIMGIYEV